MLVMMKAIGRSIDVLITATVRTQVQWPRPNHTIIMRSSTLTRRSLCSRR